MDAKHLQLFATVCAPTATGCTESAIEVWLHRAMVTYGKTKTLRLWAKLDNLNAKFMAQDARIGKEGLTAPVCV